MLGIKIASRCLIVAGFLINTGCASLMTASAKNNVEAEPVVRTFDEYVNDGDIAFKAGDLDEAQLNYALALEKNRENVVVTYKLALVHKYKKSFEVAEKLLRHAISFDGQHEPSLILLGQLKAELEQYDEAELVFQKVLENSEYSLDALNGLGVLHDMRGLHDIAQDYFNKAISTNSRSAKLANNLGYSYYLAGDYIDAEAKFLDAINYDSNYERAWSNLALMYSKMGRLRAAEAAFRKIVPEHKAANNIGYIGLLQGDAVLAQEQFNRAIDISPDYYEMANRNLELIVN